MIDVYFIVYKETCTEAMYWSLFSSDTNYLKLQKIYNAEQNSWKMVKKSRKTGQHQKILISPFA